MCCIVKRQDGWDQIEAVGIPVSPCNPSASQNVCCAAYTLLAFVPTHRLYLPDGLQLLV